MEGSEALFSVWNLRILLILGLVLTFALPEGSLLAHSKRKGRKRDHITNYEKASKRKKRRKKKKRKKKKKKKGHGRGHGHSHGEEEGHDHHGGGQSHGGHEHSSWMLGMGVTVSQSFGSSSSSSTSEGEEDHDHSEQQSASGSQLMLLDEGHDHSGQGGDGGDGGEAGGQNEFNPVFDVAIGYMVSHSLHLNLGLGYMMTGGITDPSLGGTLNFPIARRWDGIFSLAGTLPLSKFSQDDFKITTITGTAGARRNWKRYTFGFTALVAYSWYSKTIIYEDEESTTSQSNTSLSLLDEGHDHGSSSGATEQGSVKREFSRYGGNFDLLYKSTKNFQYGAAISETLIQHQFEPQVWVTDLTFAKFNYLMNGFTGSLGFAISKEAEGPSVPENLRAAAGLRYDFFDISEPVHKQNGVLKFESLINLQEVRPPRKFGHSST